MTIDRLGTSGKTLQMINDIVNRNPEPDTPCQVCGSLDWWFRLPNMIYGKFYSPGAWVCGRCHPMPGAVPAGDIIVCGSGKMRSYTIHPDGSSSCRWFPDTISYTIHPDGSSSCRWFPDTDYRPIIYRHEMKLNKNIETELKNESEESMKKVVKRKTVKQESGTNEKRSKGRPSLNISLKRICDALKTEKSIQGAAVSLGCSRGYIYKVAGVERIQKILCDIPGKSQNNDGGKK